MNPGMYSSATGEWLTPRHIVEKVVECLGHIDLDPCAETGPPWNVPAKLHFTKAEDGLAQSWWGNAYMNCPYGREIGKWVEWLVRCDSVGHLDESIALLPARTDTKWWTLLSSSNPERHVGYPVLFLRGRLHFGDSKNSAPFPSCLFYLGHDPAKFRRVFRDLGTFWVPG